MTSKIKLFAEHFVGINHKRVSTAPLAFMTPYEDNAAGLKRQATVKQWLYGYSYRLDMEVADWMADGKETRVVPNQAQAGFRVVDFANRSSTSNKLARVVDPNGFEVEISISNLIELMLTTSVDKGEIKSECIWVRDGPNNVLMCADDNRVLEARKNMEPNCKPKRKKVNHAPGDVICNSYGEYLYIGQFDVEYVIATGELNNLGGQWQPRLVPGKDSAEGIAWGRMHVYAPWYSKSGVDLTGIELLKTKKTAQQVTKHEPESVPSVSDQTYFCTGWDGTAVYDQEKSLTKRKYPNNYANYKTRWETRTIRLATDGFLEPVDVTKVPVDNNKNIIVWQW